MKTGAHDVHAREAAAVRPRPSRMQKRMQERETPYIDITK